MRHALVKQNFLDLFSVFRLFIGIIIQSQMKFTQNRVLTAWVV